MGVAQHVYRRGATYVWRRRLPAKSEAEGIVQVSLRTRDPDMARRIAAVVTAHSEVIFGDMVKKRLTPAEARGLFNRVVQQENARLADPNLTLSDLPDGTFRAPMPEHLYRPTYGLAMLRALRGDQGDAVERQFFEEIKERDGLDACYAAAYHLHEEATRYAAPLITESARPFAEQIVAAALRHGDAIADDELLAAFRVILTARASAWQPNWGLDMRSAAEIRAEDDLDPSSPKIPHAWFEDAPKSDHAGPPENPSPEPAGSQPAPAQETVSRAATSDAQEEEVSGHPDILAVADRVIDLQRDSGISPGQQQQTRQTAALFVGLTGVKDIRHLKQRHLSAFCDQLRKLPTSYGKSTKDRDRPMTEILAEAADMPPDKRGLSPATINRHLAILKRIVTRAGSEGLAVDRFLDFAVLRRKDSRRARDRRDSLTVAEVRRIFGHPVFTGCKSEVRRRQPGPHVIRDALYWLPLLAAYTGARREELAAMEARDVDEIDGIWVLHLRPNANRAAMKNASSERAVPIHSALINLGFLDYVRSVPQDGSLFPELKRKSRHAGLGADLAYSLDKVFEDQLGADRGAKSFHSFRHYVTDCLRNAPGLEKHVRLDLLGHTGENIEDETYGSAAPLAALKAAIETLPIVHVVRTGR